MQVCDFLRNFQRDEIARQAPNPKPWEKQVPAGTDEMQTVTSFKTMSLYINEKI